jgi:hypothetical protein
MPLNKNLEKILVCALFFLALRVHSETLHLKNGSVLVGERLRVEDSSVVFRLEGIGEIHIPKNELSGDTLSPPPSNSERAEETEGAGVDPSQHILVMMPTAFTAPAGTWSFEDFELLFLTLSYSPTSSTAVTLGALFPVDPGDIEVLTLGLKQRLYQTPGGHMALAVTGDFSKLMGDNSDESAFWTANLVGSMTFHDTHSGDEEMGLHAAIGEAGSLQSENNDNPHVNNGLSWALGYEMRLTPHAKFLVEYLNGGEFLGSSTNESIFNIGFRIHGQHLSADICGFRLLDEDMGNIFLIPMVNIGYRF